MRKLSLFLFLLCGLTPIYATNYIVDNLGDGPVNPSVHTLRWAVQQATDGDQIFFDNSINGQAIELDAPIIIEHDITIVGNWTTIDGNAF